MEVKYYQETKITKKNDPKYPVEVTKEGFIDDSGELKTYWDFFKDFEGSTINVSATTSSKAELIESESDEEEDGE